MRIIGGKYKQTKIQFDEKKQTTRPTKDMVREGIFSAISNDLTDTHVLDLFAGTGAYALEALSRGAKRATLVEKDKETIKYLDINTSFIKEDVEIFNLDYLDFLSKNANNKQYDIVFLDPPYDFDMVNVFTSILNFNILKQKAIIVIETSEQFFVELEHSKVKYYKYGKSYITIIWRLSWQ